VTFTCGCYRSVRQDSCRADIRMCSHCLFPVVVTSLEQVVLTLAQGCWRVTDLLQVVPTRPIQTVRNKFLYVIRACCHQPVNRDLKQTGRQRDDNGYSHNDIPDLVQKKWIIKSPTGVKAGFHEAEFFDRNEIFFCLTSTQMELIFYLLNLNNRNFGSIEKFRLVENRLYRIEISLCFMSSRAELIVKRQREISFLSKNSASWNPAFRGVVLGLFTTANQRFSRLVYNVNVSRRDKWNYKCAQQKRF
jgi:hypothetical protein